MFTRTERLLPVLAVLGLVGCSGAADTGLFGVPPSDSAATEPSEQNAKPGPSGTSSSSSGDGTGSGTTPGTPAPASPPPASPGDPGDTPAPPAACTNEVEPNDTQSKATPFTSSGCGEIGSPVDTDFFAIVAPANASKMKFSHTDGGKLSYRIFEDGDLRVSNANNTGSLSVDGGSTYTFRIAAQFPGLEKLPYEIKVTFE